MSLMPLDSDRLRRFILPRGARLPLRKFFPLALLTLVAVLSLKASAQLPGFTMTNSGPLTLASQQYGTVTVTITPVGGYSGQVDLSCGGLPVYASCNFPNSTATINLSGGAVAESLVINTSQINNYQAKSQHKGLSRIALGTLFAPAAFLMFFVRKRGMKFAAVTRLLLLMLALYPLAGLAGCAAVKPNATPPGTYNFVVYGTFSGTAADTVVTLKVT